MTTSAENQEPVKRPTLRPYQKDGVDFMLKSHKAGHGCILADEMGLGKTCQAVVTLSELATSTTSFRSLILCPLSVLQHWNEEIDRFGVGLKAEVYHGTKEEREEMRVRLQSPDQWNLLLTTYEMVLKDTDFLSSWSFTALVTDEAHRLKNHESLLYAALTEQVKPDWSLLLTGTPVQNNLSELYSLLHFIHQSAFPLTDLEAFVQRHKGDAGELGVWAYYS